MNVRERIETAIEGGTPDMVPLTTYDLVVPNLNNIVFPNITTTGKIAPDIEPLFDAGLGLMRHIKTYRHVTPGHELKCEEKIIDGRALVRYTRTTPVGSLSADLVGWRPISHFIKTPEDYRIMQWIVENTIVEPDYDQYEEARKFVGDRGVVVIRQSRTPAQEINIDLVGTEQFCIDVALEKPELFDLYNAMRELFRKECEVVANGPGRYVNWLENLTISMLGPQRYDQLLGSVYDECIPIMEAGDKRVSVHYDGALECVLENVGRTPLHIIEGVAEPPEGDVRFENCRKAWPDKVIWGNVPVSIFDESPEVISANIRSKVERAGPRGLLLEVAEDWPANPHAFIPVVLDTLKDLAR